MRVDELLHLHEWLHDVKVSSKDLSWLQLNDDTLECWSQLENLLTRLYNDDRSSKYSNINSKTLIEHAVHLISKVANEDNKEGRSYLTEQLPLSIRSPSQRRYSSTAIVAAYTLNMKSPAAYEYVRDNMLVFPSSRYLR